MAFRLTAKQKGILTVELGAEIGLQQNTAWLFKIKEQAVIREDKNEKLREEIQQMVI